MSNRLLDLLEERQVLLFDGATGTLLYSKGVFINRCFDELNLSNPNLVTECHREYAQAEVDVIETNTFGANRIKLRAHGLEDKLREINIAGAQLARQCCVGKTLIGGAVGPLGIKIEPWGPTSVEEARSFFGEQIDALVEGGVDLIVLETFGDINEIRQAMLAARERAPGRAVVAHMTLQSDGNSLYGTAPWVFAQRLDEWGADVIGVNCSVGPEVALQAVERISSVTDRPIIVQPNAGVPRNVEGRNIYLASPEYFEEYAKRFLLAGARIVGGCCGTTPQHIAHMRKALYAFSPQSRRKDGVVLTRDLKESPKEDGMEPVALEQRSDQGKAIAHGDFLKFMELVPPKGLSMKRSLRRAEKVAAARFHGVNIPDGPRASARMSPAALAIRIQQDLGVEALLHYTCRDRNLLGMQSDLFGLHALGVRNLLLVTGDPPKMGDYPDATAVFDVDSIGLTNMVSRLNRGVDIGGSSIGSPTEFVIGVGVNPGAVNLEYEMNRFAWKVDAGAHFAITQPVFAVELVEQFLEQVDKRGIRIPLVIGIWPLLSLRNAQFMNNEVPGAHVPETIMKRMASAQDVSGERARDEGVEIARETYQRLKPNVEGVQLSPPFGRVEFAMRILED